MSCINGVAIRDTAKGQARGPIGPKESGGQRAPGPPAAAGSRRGRVGPRSLHALGAARPFVPRSVPRPDPSPSRARPRAAPPPPPTHPPPPTTPPRGPSARAATTWSAGRAGSARGASACWPSSGRACWGSTSRASPGRAPAPSSRPSSPPTSPGPSPAPSPPSSPAPQPAAGRGPRPTSRPCRRRRDGAAAAGQRRDSRARNGPGGRGRATPVAGSVWPRPNDITFSDITFSNNVVTIPPAESPTLDRSEPSRSLDRPGPQRLSSGGGPGFGLRRPGPGLESPPFGPASGSPSLAARPSRRYHDVDSPGGIRRRSAVGPSAPGRPATRMISRLSQTQQPPAARPPSLQVPSHCDESPSHGSLRSYYDILHRSLSRRR